MSSDLKSINFNIYDIVAELTSRRFDMEATTFAIKLKTSLKSQTVDGIDYSLPKW